MISALAFARANPRIIIAFLLAAGMALFAGYFYAKGVSAQKQKGLIDHYEDVVRNLQTENSLIKKNDMITRKVMQQHNDRAIADQRIIIITKELSNDVKNYSRGNNREFLDADGTERMRLFFEKTGSAINPDK